jgi:hypothetical protein
LGNPVPTVLRDVFAEVDTFHQLIRSLKELRGRMHELWKHPAGVKIDTDAVEAMDYAINSLENAIPFAVDGNDWKCRLEC